MKMNIYKIKYIGVCLILSILILTGCQTRSKPILNSDNMTSATDNIHNNENIIFIDPIIEYETRKILNKNDGDIIKEDVLSIEEFGTDEYGGIFGNIYGKKITTLNDLKWFENLRILNLSNCGINNLYDIENLVNLEELYVGNNNISNIEPIKNLTNLISFDCSENNVNDYLPLSNLVNLEKLCIGNNNMDYIDLSPLKNLVNLKSLYAPWCGISDISVLYNIPKLKDLTLCNNNIIDINVLNNYKTFNYLDLSNNQIIDISPIDNLKILEYINLNGNAIPENVLKKFYEPKAEDYFIKTFSEKIKEDMPEFIFNIEAYFNKEYNSYFIKTLTVINTSNEKTIQTISIPELTFWGYTDIRDKDTMGFNLEDLNFDKYKDIKIYDIINGKHQEWIFLVWNPSKNIFEVNRDLNEIWEPTFDQENELIYGIERDSASDHNYSKYKYINGKPVLIYFCEERDVERSNEQIKNYFEMISITSDIDDFRIFRRIISEQNDKMSKMEIVSDEYVFFPYSDTGSYEEENIITKIKISSEIGQIIYNDGEP